MKIGVRKRSFKKSFKAKTTGKIKKKAKKAVSFNYGKKGSGWIKNPKRAAKNKIYHKTTVDSRKLAGSTKRRKKPAKKAAARRKQSMTTSSRKKTDRTSRETVQPVIETSRIIAGEATAQKTEKQEKPPKRKKIRVKTGEHPTTSADIIVNTIAGVIIGYIPAFIIVAILTAPFSFISFETGCFMSLLLSGGLSFFLSVKSPMTAEYTAFYENEVPPEYLDQAKNRQPAQALSVNRDTDTATAKFGADSDSDDVESEFLINQPVFNFRRPPANPNTLKREVDLTPFLEVYSVENPKAMPMAVMLNWLNNKPFGANYPQEMCRDFQLGNPQKYHQRLIEQEYLVEQPLKDRIQGLKVSELKDFLKKHSLKVSGRKNELASRIVENISRDEICERLREIPAKYRLSSSGERIVRNNSGLVWLYDNRSCFTIMGRNYWNYEQACSHIRGNPSFGEVITFICNSILALGDPEDYGVETFLADLYIKNRRPKEALLLILKAFYGNILSAMENVSNSDRLVYIPDHLLEKLREYEALITPDLLRETFKYIQSQSKYTRTVFAKSLKKVLSTGYLTEEELYGFMKETNI